MTTVLRTNARFYTPGDIAALLHDVAGERALTLVIDVDALERTQLARVEAVMLLALDELERTGVEVLLLARRGSPFRMRRFVQLHEDAEAALRSSADRPSSSAIAASCSTRSAHAIAASPSEFAWHARTSCPPARR